MWTADWTPFIRASNAVLVSNCRGEHCNSSVILVNPLGYLGQAGVLLWGQWNRMPIASIVTVSSERNISRKPSHDDCSVRIRAPVGTYIMNGALFRSRIGSAVE